MVSWQRKKLGEILTQRKEQVLIQRDVEYSLVTISNKGKVRLREKKKGALISAKKGYIAKSGDFIYSRLAVHTGAFGIVPSELDQALITGEMPCFAIDKKQVHPNILIDLIGLPDFLWQLKQLAKGMGRVRIKESMMMDLSVTLPSVTEQKKFAENLKIKKCLRNSMENEITHQQSLLKKIRQQILQEAIEGNLTAEWRQQNPDVEPASELLARIQAEKEKLIKDKKIKKQQPLPPISDAEKPFDLPDGWVWCRLGDISDKIHYGFNAAAQTHKQGIRMLRITDIQNNFVIWDNVPHCECKDKDVVKYLLSNNDILIARTGGTIGKSYIVKNIDVKSLFASYLIRVVPNRRLKTEWLKLFIESPTYWNQLYEAAWGAGQPNVNGTALSKLLIPLPPLPEQKAIVAKVEKLLNLCEQMETQITASQTHSKQLMQAVLKEFFSSNSEESLAG